MTKFILLLGVEEDLFMTMFGQRVEWSCEFLVLGDDCTIIEATNALNDPNILCCVVQDSNNETHWNLVTNHYNTGGFVAYFGIYGEFSAPTTLNQSFGVQWKYSAYTRHEYELTPVGIQLLGNAITKQRYSKSNLLSVPKEDRILVAKKCRTVEEYLYDVEGVPRDVTNFNDGYQEEYENALVDYPRHCEEMENYAPLVMHCDPIHGGRIAYIGFVNDDGKIPQFVRALLTLQQTQSS